MRNIGLVWIAGGICLAGCDGESAFAGGPIGIGDPDDESEFVATISGDVQRSLSGEATFAVTRQGNGDDSVIILLEDDDDGTIRLNRADGGAPAAGTVPVFDHREGGTAADTDLTVIWVTPEGGTFVSTGGTVTIQTSGVGILTGGLAFTARRIFQSGTTIDTLQVNITGSFEAVAQTAVGDSI